MSGSFRNLKSQIEVSLQDDSFFVRMQGDAMQDAGINDNDLLRVRPSAKANEGDIVLALVQRDLVIRRFFMDEGRVVLMPENVNFPCMVMDGYDQFELCGVIDKIF